MKKKLPMLNERFRSLCAAPVRYIAFLMLFLAVAHVALAQSPTLIWQNLSPQQFPTNLVALGDDGYLYISVKLYNQPVTNPKITITLPQGVDFAGTTKATIITNNSTDPSLTPYTNFATAAPVLSGTAVAGDRTAVITYTANSNTLRVGDTVVMKINIRATCDVNVNNPGNYTVTFSGAETIADNYKTFTAVLQKPTLRIAAVPEVIPFANILDTNLVSLNIDAQNGYAKSALITLTYNSTIIYLDSFKIDGKYLPLSNVGNTNAAAGGTVLHNSRTTTGAPTAVASQITYIRLAQSVLEGNIDNIVRNLTFRATANLGCDQTISMEIQNNLTSNCTTTPGSNSIILSLPNASTAPQFSRKMDFYVVDGADTLRNDWGYVCFDGNTPFYTMTTLINTNVSPTAALSFESRSTGGTLPHFYSDTTQVYYQVSVPSKINGSDSIVISKTRITNSYLAYNTTPYNPLDASNYLYNNSNHFTLPLLNKSSLLTINLPIDITNPLPVDAKIQIWQTWYGNPNWTIDSYRSKSDFISTRTASNYNLIYEAGAVSSKNICGASWSGGTGSYFSFIKPGFNTPGTSLTAYPNQAITISNPFSSGGSNTTSNTSPTAAKATGPRYAEVFVKLPSWCSLDLSGGGIESAFSIETVTPSFIAPAVGSGTYDAVNNIYSVRYYTNTTGFLHIKLLPGSCPLDIECDPLIDTIQIWADWISGTPETACRPRFKKVSKTFSEITMVCQTPAIEIEEFGVYRQTRGYKDSDNDHLPDDGTLALDSEMEHWHFLVGDTGYYYIKGAIGGTATNIWDTLFTDFTYLIGGALNANLQFTWNTTGTTSNHTTPFWNQATIEIKKKIEGTTNIYPLIMPNPVSPFYTLSAIYDGKTHYQPKGGDSVYIKIPFFVATGSVTTVGPSLGSIAATIVGSNAVNPKCIGFNATVSNRIAFKGLQTIARGGSEYFTFAFPASCAMHTIGKNPNGSSYPNTPNYPYQVGGTVTNTYGCYSGTYFQGNNNQNIWNNEVRNLHKLLGCTIRIPAGFYRTQEKVHFSFLKWQNRVWTPDTALYTTSATFDFATGDSLLYFDFSNIFDYDWNGSQSGITYDPVTGRLSNGKYPIGDDGAGGSFVLPLMASPGVISANPVIYGAYVFEDMYGTIMTQNSQNDYLNYLGPKLDLLTSPTTMYVNNQNLSLSSVTLQNPSTTHTNNNIWLFLKGNVENTLLIAGTDTIFGEGLNNCWLDVGTLTPEQVKNYRLVFSYKGKSTCTNDTIILYSVLDALFANYNPDITKPIDSVPVCNRGVYRPTILDPITQKAKIAGTVAVTIPNPIKPGYLHHLSPYLVDVTIDGRVSQAALNDPCVTLTVPAGQVYVDSVAAYGAAWFEYPQGNVQPIPATVLLAMESAIGVGSNDAAERSFTFCATELLEQDPFMLPGFAAINTTDPQRVIKISVPFVPTCETDLTGIRFNGTFNGKSACGDPCMDNGLQYSSPRIYSDVLTEYSFVVGLQNIDLTKRVFTPDRILDTLVATFTKTTGLTENIKPTDYILLRLPKELEVDGTILCEQFGGYAVVKDAGTVVGNERIYELSLPITQLNALITFGKADSTFKYKIPVLYTPDPLSDCSAPRHDVECQVVTNANFAPGVCAARPISVGSGKVLMLTVNYSVDDVYACLNMVTPLTVACTGVTPIWFANNAGTLPLGVTGNTYEYTPTVQKDTVFYFRAYYAYGTAEQEDFGIAPINVKMHPEVKASFTADTVCAGANTTLTNTSTIGGAASTTTNTEKWYWYLNGSTIPLDSTQNYSVALANDDQITLVVISKEGCVNSKTITVKVKPLAVINDINVLNDTICIGEIANLTATTAIINPTFRWYNGLGAGATLVGTGTPLTKAGLLSDTTFYVTVSGDGVCENANTARKPVKVVVKPYATPPVITLNDTTICSGKTATLRPTSTAVNPTFKWYSSQTEPTPFHVGDDYTTGILTEDTTLYIYVAVTGDNFCENPLGSRTPVTVFVDTMALASKINISNTNVCAGATSTLTATTSIKNPVFSWYNSQSAITPFHSGASYTTSALMADTTLYIGVSGDGYCENATGNRKPVTVSVTQRAVANDITAKNDTICTGGNSTLTVSSAIPGAVYKWYTSQTSATAVNTGATFPLTALTADTTFYIGVSGVDVCENDTTKRKAVKVVVKPYATPITITLNDTTICAGTTATLTPSSAALNPTFKWYISQTELVPFHVGDDYTTGILTKDTTLYVYVAVTGDNFCENLTGSRTPVTVFVKVCDLIDCDATPKIAATDACGTGFYTHSGAGWNIKPLGTIVFDSVKYVVNNILKSNGVSATLHGVQFTTGAPHLVEAIAYFGTTTDTCRFTVTVNALAISTESDINVVSDNICEGKIATLTATSALSNPTFRWYDSQSATATLLWTGGTFTTSALSTDTAFYVSVSNATHCENIAGTRAEAKVTVVTQPVTPVITAHPLPAFRGMPVDLSAAVDMLPGLIYTYYENADGTGKLPGSVVTYNPPKDDYYVSANNGACESDLSKIILQDPCPATVDDGESNTYKVTSLAGFCWTENLKATQYADGTPIDFANVYTCPTCPPQLDTIFGLLYDWYSAVRALRATPQQGICPNGWHVPSQAEWSALNAFPAKTLSSTMYWLNPPGPGTDDYGWDALPAGWYNSALNRYQDIYGYASWWASDDNGITASAFYISYYCDKITQEIKTKADGLSVRCVMDY